jgi:hypothetical protein
MEVRRSSGGVRRRKVPASPASLQVTANYQAQLQALAQRVQAALAFGWRQVTLDDLDTSLAAWLALTAPLVTASKGLAAQLADVYTAAYASSELGRRASPLGLAGQDYTLGLDGRTIREVLAPAGIAVKAALKESKPPNVALAAGLGRAQRTAGFEIVQTARVAQADAMRRPEVVGWRRALAAGACGACMGSATGAVHPVGDMPKVHRHDRCVAEPVVRGVRDRVERPTGEQVWHQMTPAAQDAVFSNRGGAQKADLVRAGRPLSDLVAPSPMATMPDEITETPLAALV